MRKNAVHANAVAMTAETTHFMSSDSLWYVRKERGVTSTHDATRPGDYWTEVTPIN
jgi:hypothetical protein